MILKQEKMALYMAETDPPPPPSPVHEQHLLRKIWDKKQAIKSKE
jgi:hypothetical protein